MNSIYSLPAVVRLWMTAQPQRLRFVAVLFALLLGVLGYTAHYVLAQTSGVSVTTTVTFANGTGTMDLGAAWDSTTKTKLAGELFKLEIKNNTSEAITNLQPTVALPDGFEYIAGSASSGTATQTGQTLTFSSIASLAAGATATVQYRLRATASVMSGTYNIGTTIEYVNADSSSGSAAGNIAVRVAEGFSVITKTPNNAIVPINGQVTWDVTVTNTGLGGLFDVEIEEMPDSGLLEINSITATSSTGLTVAESGRKFTLPYLAPEETFTLTVTGTVIGCGDIQNTASTDDLTGKTKKDYSVSVMLDLGVPLIAYTAPDITLNYGTSTTVSFDVSNTGNGTARGVALQTNLHQLPVQVTNVSSDWDYENGKFTLKSNSGRLGHDDEYPLSFDLTPSDVCTDDSLLSVIWTAQYTNDCGDEYSVPSQIQAVSPPADAPTIDITKVLSSERLVVGQEGEYTIQLNVTNPQFIDGDVVVTDDITPLLSRLENVAVGTASSGAAVLDNNVITWTVPAGSFDTVSDPTLKITFDVKNDPCSGGEIITNTAEFTARTTASCDLNGSATTSLLVANNPFDAHPDQYYNVERSLYQTGYSSTNPAPTNDDYVNITSSYEFGISDTAPFSGGTYIDDFAGLGTQQQLVAGSLEVNWNGLWVPVPSGSIIDTIGRLEISLDFLAGTDFFNDDNVRGKSFSFRYRTTISDAALGGAVSRGITQRGTLTLAGTTAGACGDVTFVQGDNYTIRRAEAHVAISVPQNIERCDSFPVMVTVSNPSPTDYDPYNVYDLVASIDLNDGYRLDTSVTPVLGGDLAGSEVDITTDPEKPTVTLPGPLAAGASGTVTFQVSLKADADISSSIPGISARIDYNDNETQSTLLTPPREFSDTTSGKPALVRSADIKLFVTPQNITVDGETVEWHIYVLNAGNGTAVAPTLEETIPTSFVVDETATNDANGVPVSMSGASPDVASWDLPDIPAGGSRLIKVIANVDPDAGLVCDINGIDYPITATWGCGGSEFQTTTKDSPRFVFPDGSLQILHDTTNSFFELCGEGEVVIVVRNVGKAYVYDAEITENLVSELSYVPNSTEYSIDSGTSWHSTGNPAITGNTLKWTKNQIAQLEKLAPQSAPSGVKRIRIRFKVASDESLSNDPAPPQIQASAEGQTACGSALNPPSPGVPFALPAKRPVINVTKEGRNVTTGQVDFSKTVYGGAGDVVEWKVTVKNDSTTGTTAKNVRLEEVFAGSGAASYTVVGQAPSTINTTMTGDGIITIDDIPAGESREYIITETLGSSCVNALNTAKVTWGCTDNGPNAESNVSYPGRNTDTARLNMLPNLSDNAISHNITHLPNGRIKGEVKIKNNGGTGEDLKFTLDLSAFPSMALDDSTGQPSGSDIVLTGTQFTGVMRTAPVGGKYEFIFTGGDGKFRNDEEVTVNYYLIQAGNFDTAANGGPAGNLSTLSPGDIKNFEYPETVDNGLDPALPAAGNIGLKVEIESTCGASIEEESTLASVTPQTPDLDIRVSPQVQVVQTGAQYTLGFRFYVKNEQNGRAGTNASNVTFSLPEVGGKWTSVTIDGPNGESATGLTGTSIDLTNPIAPGAEVEIKVTGITATIDPYTTPGEDVGLRLIGEVVGEVHNQNGTFVGNYSFDRAAPAISSDVNVSGYVYLDANANLQRDSGEGGIGSPPAALWAKLVKDGEATAVQVVSVDLSSGAYLFEVVGLGSYTIVINENDDVNDIAPAVLSTYGYTGTEMPGLVRPVIVGNTSLHDQNFGLFKGRRVTGTVFQDTGDGTGTANDGTQNGSEKGIPNVRVRALDSADNVLDSATTDPDGKYELFIPAVSGEVRIVQTNLTGYISTGADVGTSGGTYDRATDTVTFDALDSNHNGIDFGDVPQSTFTIDGSKTVLPGSSVQFPHVFTAGTDGEVTFSVDGPDASPYLWTYSIYHDTNGNGKLDSGEPLLSNPTVPALSVSAGEEVHIIVRVFSPATVTPGMDYTVTVEADFVLDTATPAITEELTRTDKAIVNDQDKLTLVKVVDETEANRGQELTYTITYRNDTDKPITDLVISDSVPAYTDFVSASNGPLPAGLTGVTLAAPATPPLPGDVAIKWTFTGVLDPNEEGTVTFTVRVQ